MQTLGEEAALTHSLVEFVLTDGKEEERASGAAGEGRVTSRRSISPNGAAVVDATMTAQVSVTVTASSLPHEKNVERHDSPNSETLNTRLLGKGMPVRVH